MRGAFDLPFQYWVVKLKKSRNQEEKQRIIFVSMWITSGYTRPSPSVVTVLGAADSKGDKVEDLV